MKIRNLICLALLIGNIVSFGQSRSYKKYDRIKDKSLYIHYEFDKEDKISLKFFTDIEDNKEPLKNIEKLGLTTGFTNIYMLWINPLKYELSWKDSIYLDERDKIISSFFDLYPTTREVTDINRNENKKLAKAITPKIAGSTKLYVPIDGYNSTTLMELYFRFIEDFNKIQGTEADVIRINQVLTELKNLDTYDSRFISKEVKEGFSKLIDITDPYKVNVVIESIDIEGWNGQFIKIDKSIEKVEEYISGKLITSDNLLNMYVKALIKRYIKEVKDSVSKNERLVKYMAIIINKMKRSIIDESNIKKYYYVRDIYLEEGKALNTEIKIHSNDIDQVEFLISKKSEIFNSKIIFVKHDWIDPFVSIGVFSSSTDINGYGVKTNDNGELIVVEDNISKNRPVSGVFLNFQFANNSRYLAPIVQLGIDPTKKQPFLLAGGGIAVPSAKFAISAGVIWTWAPSLDSLSVGDVVESTVVLDEDIIYDFPDITSAGIYFGIQYNF